MNTLHSYQDLIVWQRAVDLAVALFALTDRFPRTEETGLTAAIRRTAIAIPAQVAAGHNHGGKAFIEALRAACGSAAELATYIRVAELTPHVGHCDFTDVKQNLDDVAKMLGSLFFALKAKQARR